MQMQTIKVSRIGRGDIPSASYLTQTWSLQEVRSFIARLKVAGYKVKEFGSDGWATEINGSQIFRATNTGAERYQVRYDGRIFADV